MDRFRKGNQIIYARRIRNRSYREQVSLYRLRRP
jgi:hypothetical protein